jgi:TolB-like protein/Tfp pilus assembly protein PilF
LRGAPDDPVIAVLPFANLSTEDGSEVFVQGLGVEVQSQLAAIDGLRVLSPLSSFPLKDRGADLTQIRRVLGANLVLSVSVRRSGDRLKVDPQLIQAADGAVIWADSFDGELKDIFAIQQQIALAIVNELRLTLGRGQRRYDTDPRTYELYLKARSYVGLKDPDNAQAAAELFEQVIARDANYAPAHAGLADAYAFWSITYAGAPSDKAFAVMRAAAARALELDPLLAEAHAALGLVRTREYEWNKAGESFERAIELNPSLTQSHTNYVLSVLLPLGRFDEALQVLETARGYDPLSLDVRRITALVHLFAARYPEAIAGFEAVLKVDPQFPYAVKDYPRALTFGGRLGDALAAYERDTRPVPHYQAFAYVMAGNRSAVERLLDANKGFPVRELGIHTALGNMDGAFEALERALVSDAHRIALFLKSPEMAPIRADPRYDAIRRRLKLP